MFNPKVPVFCFDAVWISRDHPNINFGQTGEVYLQNNVKFFLPHGSGDAMFCYDKDYFNVTAYHAGLATEEDYLKIRGCRASGIPHKGVSKVLPAREGRIVVNRSIWKRFVDVLSSFSIQRVLFK
jgi:hypothetical protein